MDSVFSSAYPYIPAKDQHHDRSPCPALNTLANHGYIPRNGRNITLKELVWALYSVYHISFALAIVLSLVGIVKCGNGATLNLHDLAKHNVIEHDGSTSHKDCVPGEEYAPTEVDRIMLGKLVRRASPGHGLSLLDFSRARASLNAALNSPLDRGHSEIANGESALTWLVMRNKQDEVPVSTMWEWYGDERLPTGYRRPAKSIGVLDAMLASSDVRKRSKEIQRDISPASPTTPTA